MAHLMNNTDKAYPCPNCGTPGNIIRESADPRLKCNNMRCNFMYDGSDSLAAVEAGAIPDAAPELHEPTPSEAISLREDVRGSSTGAGEARTQRDVQKLPRTLSFVVVSKDRTNYEFTTSKGLRRVIFEWETAGTKYEVFQLSPKKVSANVDIS